MRLIVGLGNPGKQYEKTRHNMGFLVLDALHTALQTENINAWEVSKKFNAMVSGCSVRGEKILLAKPLTFMNDSGNSVVAIAQFYKIQVNDLMVVHDEKDLLLGTLKIQTGKNDAGHNGVASVIDRIGTKDFTRVRVGIGSDNKKKMRDAAAFVLGKFGFFEKKTVQETIHKSVQEILLLLNLRGKISSSRG